jgi:hypothetical protein
MLRELLLLGEEGDNAGLYSEAERAELLWRLFQHLCLGGPCCQFEVRCSSGGPAAPPSSFAQHVLPCCRHAGGLRAHLLLAVLPPQDQLEGYLQVTKQLYKELLRWAWCGAQGPP